MGVQDIVQRYESKASGSDSTGSVSRRSKYKSRTSDAETIPPGPRSNDSHDEKAVREPVLEPTELAPIAMPHRPARFVRHPFFQPHYQRVEAPNIPLRILSKSPERSEAEVEGLPMHHTPTLRATERTRTPTQHSDASTLKTDGRTTKLVKQSVGSVAASTTAVSSADGDGVSLAGSHSAHLLPTPKDPSAPAHRPVPAPTLFGRNAAPLYLPKLDKHLSSLPAPEFTKWKGKGKETDVPMFPPMEQLAASGRTIDDLEHNSMIPPAWQDRNFWFSLAKDSAISVLVCELGTFSYLRPNQPIQGSSALAPFYSVQGLIDTIQIFALLLSTIGSFTT